MTVWLNFERLPDNALDLPNYATDGSAGIDFAACLTRPCKTAGMVPFYMDDDGNRHEYHVESQAPKLIIAPNETIMVSLGYKCEFNAGSVLILCVRSSLGLRGLCLANGVGVIDSDYRGELFACLHNYGQEPLNITHGQRIVQGLLLPCPQAIITSVKVNETGRGEGGFGSTGH